MATLKRTLVTVVYNDPQGWGWTVIFPVVDQLNIVRGVMCFRTLYIERTGWCCLVRNPVTTDRELWYVIQQHASPEQMAQWRLKSFVTLQNLLTLFDKLVIQVRKGEGDYPTMFLSEPYWDKIIRSGPPQVRRV